MQQEKAIELAVKLTTFILATNGESLKFTLGAPKREDIFKLFEIETQEQFDEIKLELGKTGIFEFAGSDIKFTKKDKFMELYRKVDGSKIKEKFNCKLNIEDDDIKNIVDSITSRFKDKELQPHQVLIERYKDLKKYSCIDKWDEVNFVRHVRPALALIKQTGFTKAMKLLDYAQSKGPAWSLFTLIKWIPYYERDAITKGKFNKFNEGVLSEYK